MLDLSCNDASNIFALGVAFNGVVVALGQTAREARMTYLREFADAAYRTHPAIRRGTLVGNTLDRLAFEQFPDFPSIVRYLWWIQAYALLMVGVSIATLLQLAHWGSACKITAISLYAFVVFALVVGPVCYWGLRWLLNSLTDEIAVGGLDEGMDAALSEFATRMDRDYSEAERRTRARAVTSEQDFDSNC